MNRSTYHTTESEALAVAQAHLERINAGPRYNVQHKRIARADYYEFEDRKGWIPTIAGQYAVIERTKKTAPWRQVGEVYGSCDNDADDRAGVDFLASPCLKRAVLMDEWIAIQTRQHLKAIGHKTPRKAS